MQVATGHLYDPSRQLMHPHTFPSTSMYTTLVYADFLGAVGLLVVTPLLLLGASVFLPAVRHRLLVYWRTSSLLGITVYLLAGSMSMGFATGFAARALIPLALWRGDAVTVLRDQALPPPSSWQAVVYRHWHTAAVAYNVVGLVYMLPLLGCIGADAGALCQAWYAPPQQYAAWLHPGVDPTWLGRYGWVALGLYAAYLLASAVRLRRHLRAQRRS